MTVRDLLQELERLDPSLEVELEVEDCGISYVTWLKSVEEQDGVVTLAGWREP